MCLRLVFHTLYQLAKVLAGNTWHIQATWLRRIEGKNYSQKCGLLKTINKGCFVGTLGPTKSNPEGQREEEMPCVQELPNGGPARLWVCTSVCVHGCTCRRAKSPSNCFSSCPLDSPTSAPYWSNPTGSLQGHRAGSGKVERGSSPAEYPIYTHYLI